MPVMAIARLAAMVHKKGAAMARKTNYKFEKLERERRKAEKKAAKAEAKKAAAYALKDPDALGGDEQQPDAESEGV